MRKQQEKIYNIIKDFINKNGYAPTVREIGKIAGLNSSSTVHSHLTVLESEGYIKSEKGKSRTIRIIK